MHLKRQKVPKSWPIKRKGTAFVVRSNFSLKKGLPILVILRDALKLAQNRKEVKKAIHEKNILLNKKIVKNEKNTAQLFDVVTIPPLKKDYRLGLAETGKFKLDEIEQKDSDQKVSKVINKKMLKNKKVQLNLSDGNNFLSDIKCGVNDSVIINFERRKIEKHLPLKEKSNVLVFAGKHSGKKGVVNKIDLTRNIANLDTGKEKINALIKQLIVIE